ncbi:hypothetical protein A7M79_07315 [Acinetobacter baumannii]|uniref:hypothetical protein n=1 Tax=Acinetobacter baumannii TaxID=470 RepID=UPI0008DE6584|nr:hypothetical protein [Acinetobacter baumannii]OIH08615.1 hypothetical protein A7M79_07315 [Acinetobacter baumannii]
MQSMNTEINTEKTHISIDFAHKTMDFYDQFHQQTTDTLQEYLGLLEFKVNGISAAIEDLLVASQRMAKMHSSPFEGDLIEFDKIINDVHPLIEKLSNYPQQLIPFYEVPIAGGEHCHILSIEEGKVLIDSINQAKLFNKDYFDQIKLKYSEFPQATSVLPDLKSLDVYERMVKAKEFSEKAIYGFRHLFSENLEFFNQFTNNFKLAVKRLDEIYADLSVIYTKLTSAAAAIKALGSYDANGNALPYQHPDNSLSYDFFLGLGSIEKNLQRSAEKLGFDPESIVRNHNYQALDKTYQVWVNYRPHPDYGCPFSQVMGWIQSVIKAIEYNANAADNFEKFKYPVRRGYLLNAYSSSTTTADIYSFSDKIEFRLVSGEFKNNFKVDTRTILSVLQRQLIEMLPYWLEANAGLIFQKFGRKVDASEIGVSLVENRLSISLWGYGSLNWFDIKDVVRIANKPKMNVPKFVLDAIATLNLSPEEQPYDIYKIRVEDGSEE